MANSQAKLFDTVATGFNMYDPTEPLNYKKLSLDYFVSDKKYFSQMRENYNTYNKLIDGFIKNVLDYFNEYHPKFESVDEFNSTFYNEFNHLASSYKFDGYNSTLYINIKWLSYKGLLAKIVKYEKPIVQPIVDPVVAPVVDPDSLVSLLPPDEKTIQKNNLVNGRSTLVDNPLVADVKSIPKIEVDKMTKPKYEISLEKPMPYYDVKDKYYLKDYINWITKKTFTAQPGTEEFTIKDKLEIVYNLSRCVRTIVGGNLIYICKTNARQNFDILNLKDYKPKDWKFSLKIVKKDKDGNDVTKIVTHYIFKFINEYSLQANEIVCEPYHEDKKPEIDGNVFNTFAGLKAKWIGEVKEGDNNYKKIEPILYHIYAYWCKKDMILYNYMISLIARSIRELSRTDKIFVLKGIQGCGKSTIINFIMDHIYGEYTCVRFDTIDQVLDKFNALLVGKIFVLVNEGKTESKQEFTRCYNKLKSMADSPTILVEDKFKSKYTVRNIINVNITTNFDCIKMEESSSNRRYFVLESSDEVANNPEYFAPLRAACADQECGDIFYSYMRSDWPLTDLTNPPMTSYKQELTNAAMPNHKRFVHEAFEENSIPLPLYLFRWDDDRKIYYFARQNLYDIYEKKHKVNLVSNFNFSKHLKTLSYLSDHPNAESKIILREGPNQGTRTAISFIDPSIYNNISVVINYSDAFQTAKPLYDYYYDMINGLQIN